jgi:hypothetical protein
MNMTALSEEATKQLSEISGYLIPPPMMMSEINSIGLSALADVAEFIDQRYPRNNFDYPRLLSGQHFPVNLSKFASLPSVPQGIQPGVPQSIPQGVPQGVPQGIQQGAQQGAQQGVQQGVQHSAQQGVQHGIQQGIQQGVPPGIPSGVQHGIQPGIQPGVQHGPQQRRAPPPQPAQTFIFHQQFFNHPQQRMPPPPQPIPVTFVNSTVSSRKSGNKGGQRILLPKMG